LGNLRGVAQNKTRRQLKSGSGFLEPLIVNVFAILDSESQSQTRCLDANDGWHGDASGGCDGFW
jgi:hypothetical protein